MCTLQQVRRWLVGDRDASGEDLERMPDHDRGVLHEKYGSVAEQLEVGMEDWVLTE